MKAIKTIEKRTEHELRMGINPGGGSWHDAYRGSAYIYVGGLPYDLNEGDIIQIFSQYGEVTRVNLVRDKRTGKSSGYAFLSYADQRSTVLAVDNFNGIKVLGRTIRVDHVKEYKRKKDGDEVDEGVVPEISQEELERERARENEDRRKRMKLAQETIRAANGEAGLVGLPIDGGLEGEENEEVITKDLQEIENEIQRAERKVEKARKRLRKKKITQEEFDRYIMHIDRVKSKLEKRQQKLWDSKM